MFCGLSARNNENEEQLVLRYILGPSVPVQERLELSLVWTLDEAMSLANKVDKHVNRNKNPIKWKSLSDYYSEKSKTNSQPQTQQPNTKPIDPHVKP